MAVAIPELSPQRFDVDDREGLRAHLLEHGYACVKEAARPHELEHGKYLLDTCSPPRQRRSVIFMGCNNRFHGEEARVIPCQPVCHWSGLTRRMGCHLAARSLFWEWLEQPHWTKDGHQTHGFDRSDPTTVSELWHPSQ